jgi:hypothetical protein
MLLTNQLRSPAELLGQRCTAGRLHLDVLALDHYSRYNLSA